jgi:hypothetical protein
VWFAPTYPVRFRGEGREGGGTDLASIRKVSSTKGPDRRDEKTAVMESNVWTNKRMKTFATTNTGIWGKDTFLKKRDVRVSEGAELVCEEEGGGGVPQQVPHQILKNVQTFEHFSHDTHHRQWCVATW